MKHFFSIIAAFIFIIPVCQGQDTPLSIAKSIFDKTAFSDLDDHIIGEYKGRPNGTDLPKNIKTEFLLLGQFEKTAVINLTIIDSLGDVFDSYLHFEKDQGIWKMSAFRALAMTSIISKVKDELEKMSDTQIDSIIEKSKKDSTNFSMFKSKKEYQFELGNSRLTLASDQEIIDHFKKNETEFNRIRDLFITGEKTIKFRKEYEAEYRELFISSISNGGLERSNLLEFRIGGILDNTVGYYYSKNNDVPGMNPSNMIMIREIGNGWYMYKTT